VTIKVELQDLSESGAVNFTFDEQNREFNFFDIFQNTSSSFQITLTDEEGLNKTYEMSFEFRIHETTPVETNIETEMMDANSTTLDS
jgi:hypothetical protein